MRIYLAGPLFTTAERDFNAALAAGLRALGHEVWVPQESEQQQTTAKAIFDSDVRGIDWCEVVVACMDGADPDSGTCWEVGSVWRRKPTVLYRTDIRSEYPHRASPSRTRHHVHPIAIPQCQRVQHFIPPLLALQNFVKIDQVAEGQFVLFNSRFGLCGNHQSAQEELRGIPAKGSR
jgi:nucleoside 2-deoxyribosyltransferase